MIEGGGSLDHLTVAGDNVSIDTVKDGFLEPTSVVQVGNTAWVTEGQLSHIPYPDKAKPPKLPFQVYAVPLPTH
jgi:hypothetical protein